MLSRRTGPPTVGGMTDLRRSLGNAGERIAEGHLERLGLRILARNYRTRWGELDLVAYDGERIVFCEVKTRCSGAGHPFDALGDAKRERVRRMAARWLAETDERPRAAELRFDAIGVTLDPRGRLLGLDHLEDAF